MISVSSLVEKQSDLPRLRVSVGGTELSALVDSGTAATLISASVWRGKMGQPALTTDGSVQLRSVTGGTLNNLGGLKVPVSVGRVETPQEVQVIEGLPYDLLLGIDYIRASRMVLNAADVAPRLRPRT